jgi:RNA 2',3'-cyclic 3'-phosphodiesterase
MKRLFIGIPLPEIFVKELSAFKNENQFVSGLRWVPERNLHITLCFIGDKEEHLIPEIEKQIETVIRNISSFTLDFENFQFGPFPKKAYMLWATFRNNEFFNNISSIFEKEILNNNNPRKPKSHITLARFKRINKEEVNLDFPIEINEVNVTEIYLYESELKESGAEYNVINKFKLE